MLVLLACVMPHPICSFAPTQFSFGLPLLQASPVLIGGWQAVVEEKRSTNSRGKLNDCPLEVIRMTDV